MCSVPHRTQDGDKKDDRKKDDRRKKHKPKDRLEEEAGEDRDPDEEGWEKVKGGVPLVKEKPKMFAKGTEINSGVVIKKLHEILQARGKKGTDRYRLL